MTLRIALIFVIVLGILVSAGCSGSAAPSSSSSAPAVATTSVQAAATRASAAATTAAASQAAPKAPAGAVSNEAADSAKASASASSGTSNNFDNGRMVIRNGDLVIVVKDVPASVDAINRLGYDLGGYVGQSSVRRDNDRVNGEITINVPSERYNDAMSSIRGMAVKIETDNTTTQDVTDEFIDNEARLRTLKIIEESTQKLLDRADALDKIFTIQRELTNIRTEIEKIQGRQNYIQRRVSVSTIRVRLSGEVAPAPVVTAKVRSGFEPGLTAQVAWENSLNFLSGIATVLITLIVVLWWVIPIALIAWWFVRRYLRNRKTNDLALSSQPNVAHATANSESDKSPKKPQANPT